jgi:hypothetical protein
MVIYSNRWTTHNGIALHEIAGEGVWLVMAEVRVV